ncbi:MAG TPA: glycerophosphodiester phosphodiesterase family protein [Candidatus Limnocylindria bacterium]|nr:glycerophosphodiester phosphodiesterase family protein [Candidatus Limnocylindria bacterium]
MTLVVAHRGASVMAPENTMPAFELALRQGADAIELDIHLTADGQLAVIHDPDLDRTTDRGGQVASLEMDDIRAADAGARFAGEGGDFPFRDRDVRVPSLTEVLDWLPDGTGLVIEVKAPAAVEVAAALVAGHPAGREGRISLISFYEAAIDRARQLAPRIPTGLLLVPFADFATGLAYAVGHGHLGVHPWDGDLGLDPAPRLAEAIAYGRQVGCYVVNDPDRMVQLAAGGLWGFVTDRPDIGRSALGPITR